MGSCSNPSHSSAPRRVSTIPRGNMFAIYQPLILFSGCLSQQKSSTNQSLSLKSSALPCRVLQDDQLAPRSSGCRGPLSRWGWRSAGSRVARADAVATTASGTRSHGLRLRNWRRLPLLMGVPQRPQTIRPARLRSARMVQLPHWEQAMVLAILIFPAWLGGAWAESATTPILSPCDLPPPRP